MLRTFVLLLSGALVSLAPPACAEDPPVPVNGKSLRLRSAGAPPSARFDFRGTLSSAVRLPFDPVAGGASLIVRGIGPNAGTTGRIDLPASRWAKRPRGFVYLDPDGTEAGVQKVVHRASDGLSRVRVRARGGAWPWIPSGSQDAVQVLLRMGTEWVCAEFGGDIRRNEAGRFVAAEARAPRACPTICDGDPCDRPGDLLVQSFLGEQRALFMRVKYDGDEGPILSDLAATELGDELGRAFALNSYGKAALTYDVTPPLDLGPEELYAESYSPIASIREAAVRAAENVGYDVDSYGREVIFSRRVWGGSIGQGTINMRTSFVGCGAGCTYLTAHEVGHSLGFFHASLWWLPNPDASPIGPNGIELSYGDAFDIMGDQVRGRPRGFHHFNPVYKKRAGWLRDAEIETVLESGTYVLRPFGDASNPSAEEGFAALRIPTDRRRQLWKGDYWVFFRADEPFAADGAVITWGYDTNTRNTRLLDMSPGSLPEGEPTAQEDWKDAVLFPGQVFADVDAGIELEVVHLSDDELWVEVRVTPDAALGEVDRPPVVGLASPQEGETLQGSATYEVTAYDPDVGEADGDGIERVRLELHELTDALMAPLIVGEPPNVSPAASIELGAPPYRMEIEDLDLPTAVYSLMAVAVAEDGGRTVVGLPHVIVRP